MILDRNKTQKLLTNKSLGSLIPELAPFVRQAESVKNSIYTGACRPCQENAKMAPIVVNAQAFIAGFSSEKVVILKKILGVSGKLYIYAPNQSGKPGLKEIN